MRRSSRERIPTRRLGLLLAVLLGVTACDGAVAEAPVPEVTFVVVGDSLTAGLDAPLDGARIRGTNSWVHAADRAPARLVGGWAVPGARTADMRANVEQQAADVLVVMAGTNDLIQGVPWETSRRNLLAVVAAAGIDDVVLAAVPPLDSAPLLAVAYDFRLAELAAEQGWQFVDPWTEVWVDGRWAPGAGLDGVHPTQAAADRAGEVLRAALLDRLSGPLGSPG